MNQLLRDLDLEDSENLTEVPQARLNEAAASVMSGGLFVPQHVANERNSYQTLVMRRLDRPDGPLNDTSAVVALVYNASGTVVFLGHYDLGGNLTHGIMQMSE